jgi:hypothetical protein
MQATSANPRRAAEQVATSSYQATHNFRQIMVPLNIAHIIKDIMSLATEAELAALYIMAQEAVYIRIILEKMGLKQLPTLMQTDNAMADGIINGKVQPKRTKAMDMRFHWL